MGSAFIQTTTSQNVGADQEGIGISGSAASAVARDAGTAVSGNAQVGGVRSGVDVSASNFGTITSKTNTGVDLAGTNTGTITINQAAGVESLGEIFDATLNKLADKSDATLNAALQQKAAATTPSEPAKENSLARQALWGLGILVAGGIAFAIFDRRGK